MFNLLAGVLPSRRSEAHRGLPEARPRTQNVLARGQSEAHGDSNLYNTIVRVPWKWRWCGSEIVVPCRILDRSWRKETASWKPRSNENICVYQHQASFQAGFEAALEAGLQGFEDSL